MPVLDGSRTEDKEALEKVAEEQPPTLSGTDDVAQLPSQPPGSEEEAKSNSNVGGDEHFTIELWEDQGKAEENSVSCLIGREAVVVWEGSGI